MFTDSPGRRRGFYGSTKPHPDELTILSENTVFWSWEHLEFCFLGPGKFWKTVFVSPYEPCLIYGSVFSDLIVRWLGGSVVRVWFHGRKFDSWLVHCQVTTLGKLFTPVQDCH